MVDPTPLNLWECAQVVMTLAVSDLSEVKRWKSMMDTEEDFDDEMSEEGFGEGSKGSSGINSGADSTGSIIAGPWERDQSRHKRSRPLLKLLQRCMVDKDEDGPDLNEIVQICEQKVLRDTADDFRKMLSEHDDDYLKSSWIYETNENVQKFLQEMVLDGDTDARLIQRRIRGPNFRASVPSRTIDKPGPIRPNRSVGRYPMMQHPYRRPPAGNRRISGGKTPGSWTSGGNDTSGSGDESEGNDGTT